jgi:hypothetical protein
MLKVKITDYGYSEDLDQFFVTYLIEGLDDDEISILQNKLEDPIVIKSDKIYLSTYFDENYFPFRSPDSKRRINDYIAREEIEMTAYILDLLSEI